MSRPSKFSGAEVRRFVYRADSSEYDGRRYAMAHPVLKWSGKRVYVNEKCCSADLIGTVNEPVFDHGPDDRTFLLDRAALESEGHVYPRSRRWCDLFYLRLEDALDPHGYRNRDTSHDAPSDDVTEALTILGLSWPCTREEFRAAYHRRSKETHPDSGGASEDFVVVNTAYETLKDRLGHWPIFSRVG